MIWRYEINLNVVLSELGEEFDLSRHEEFCPEEVRELLAKECEKARPLRRFATPIRDAQSIAEVNRILENVYDVADIQGVWCGFSG